MSEPVILVLLAALVMALLLVPFFRRRHGAMPPTRAASIPRVEVVDERLARGHLVRPALARGQHDVQARARRIEAALLEPEGRHGAPPSSAA